MFERVKAKLLFGKLLSRPDISKAYKMVGPEDSWYNTISCVHNSLAEIQKLPHETVEIKSFDGLKLQGIYYPAESKSDKTVICIHGFGSHAEREWAFPGLFYHSLGFNVLIPYQRAHGLSEGKRITFGALERFDVIKWTELVNGKAPNGRILLHGLSMGGLIALILSDIEIPGVQAIISDAPSPGIEFFFRNVSNEVFKSGRKRVAECGMADFKASSGFDAGEFNAIDHIKRSRYPVLLSAGELEGLDDMLHGLKDASPCPTEIIILPGCNHGNGMYKQTEMYQGKIKEFISNFFE